MKMRLIGFTPDWNQRVFIKQLKPEIRLHCNVLQLSVILCLQPCIASATLVIYTDLGTKYRNVGHVVYNDIRPPGLKWIALQPSAGYV